MFREPLTYSYLQFTDNHGTNKSLLDEAKLFFGINWFIICFYCGDVFISFSKYSLGTFRKINFIIDNKKVPHQRHEWDNISLSDQISFRARNEMNYVLRNEIALSVCVIFIKCFFLLWTVGLIFYWNDMRALLCSTEIRNRPVCIPNEIVFYLFVSLYYSVWPNRLMQTLLNYMYS